MMFNFGLARNCEAEGVRFWDNDRNGGCDCAEDGDCDCDCDEEKGGGCILDENNLAAFASLSSCSFERFGWG
jgi:hypothetical protein